ncbi:UbiA family prenyltransferase [Roseomonas nepalensis]|uniref:UbiA family prenyltransferase n=1 Tax=Muricoccus nepalensis TaxID=1854500 RepID=A0A502FSI6_9PROT|nr:UbiA family prenyltransferase [Roseomonas nepalensis]TPG52369.1 UbiA family prenyltransferase [Roseomonas nepalensis]
MPVSPALAANPAPPALDDARLLPLCVDLDGTLTPSDTLLEGLLATLGRPSTLGVLPALLRRGRAGLKRFVAEAAPLEASLLPYSEPLLRYLRAQRVNGRRVVLVTAADRDVARRVADHLGLFDEVIASDGRENLRGAAKAAALVRRFGHGGFAYAGNDATDLLVWRAAGAAILVNAPPRVAAAARGLCPVEAEFPPSSDTARGLLRAVRPHQWSKNLLVFVPVFTAHLEGLAEAWLFAFLAFLAFSATASAIYLINDLTDLAADRRHPRKRLRPFASGRVPPRLGILAAGALLLAGLATGGLSGTLPTLLLYAVLSTAYSLRLKELPLVDVFTLAGLYTLRLLAGAEALGQPLSLWLMGFSAFFFLSLALVKRSEELRAAAEHGNAWLNRRGYRPADAGILQTFGVAAAFAATLVLALFVQSETTAQRYASPGLLWAVVPLVVFWLCRIWLSAARGYMHDDPIVYAARDRVSWVVATLVFLILVAAKSYGGAA